VLAETNVVDVLFDVSSDTRPGSRGWVDDSAGSGTRPRMGGLSVLPEETVTGSGWDNIDSVVPPDSAPCESGVDGVGDGSVGLTSRLSEAFGSLWSDKSPLDMTRNTRDFYAPWDNGQGQQLK
jgi:hypothetical protein